MKVDRQDDHLFGESSSGIRCNTFVKHRPKYTWLLPPAYGHGHGKDRQPSFRAVGRVSTKKGFPRRGLSFAEMKILELSIKNLRSLAKFELGFEGDSVFLIGENGSGKTTVLDAVARTMGRARRLTRSDFGDLERPIEIEVKVGELSTEQRGLFADEIDFTQPVTLTLGVKAVWDADLEVVDLVHGFPHRDWKKTKREQREALSLEWLPDTRNIGAMLQLGRPRTLVAKLVEGLSIESSIEEAAQGISDVRQKLSEDASLKSLFVEACQDLGRLVPGITEDVFSVGSSDATTEELLGDLEIFFSHYGHPVPLPKQSSGLGQLAGFAFAMQLVRKQAGTILLIDEPEKSLHPQAQRALIRALNELPCQTVIATHSSNLLDRVDPRKVIRLFRIT